MCGIIGFFGFPDAYHKVAKGLQIMKNRGLDGVGFADEKQTVIQKSLEIKEKTLKSKNVIGHCLHAVVNFVPQPLESKQSKCIINGEIYNWKFLNEKYKLNARNDSEAVFKLFEKNQLRDLPKVLEELDGVFAFAYWRENKVILARDLIGVKPLWISIGDQFAFASEKKALLGPLNIEELNPRTILVYDLAKQSVHLIQREFFSILPEHRESYQKMVEKVKSLVNTAIQKRIPEQKFGILFSGGLESSIIALVCKQLNLTFTCYTSAVKSKQEPIDLVYAKKVAKHLNIELKYKEVEPKEVPAYLKKVVPLIEDTNPIKVGVGLTIYVAAELAQKDGCKVIFSGVGSEELFAGYERHKKSANANQECLSGVRRIYERDLYRDDVITMNHNLELRLPFLDKSLTEYALKIPDKHKIKGDKTKVILRNAAKLMGLPEEIAERPRKAAQYGSGFDKALVKLTKQAKHKTRSAYLKQFYPYPNVKLAALISGGKDSWYAASIMQKQNYEISCLVSLASENKDSYMYHTPNIELVKLQSKASKIPLIMQKTKGEKEEELKDLEKALKKAKHEFQIEGVVAGAIFSQYQRERIEKISDKMGLKIFVPLWHMNQELLLRNLLEEEFSFMVVAIAAEGLDPSWLGKIIIEEDINKLVLLQQKLGLNCAGEGGEYETFVLHCPLFFEQILVKEANKVIENQYTGRYLIKNAELS